MAGPRYWSSLSKSDAIIAKTKPSGRDLTPPGNAAILSCSLEMWGASPYHQQDAELHPRKDCGVKLQRATKRNSFVMTSILTALDMRARRMLRLITMPLLHAPEEALMGGQAVIEGVMMRSPHCYAVAVRQPSGSLAVTQAYLDRPSDRHPWLKLPILRGLGVLGQALVLGMRALRYSAEQALVEPEAAGSDPAKNKKPAELSGWMLAANIAFSLAFFIVLYKLVPLYLATVATHRYLRTDSNLAFNLLDGTIRIVLFLGFLLLISQWKEIQRVFEYHGAEHKVVWAFEKRGPINVAAARACTRFHPRCGTSFLLVVMGIAMVVYMFLPFHTFWLRFLGRIVLLPVIAGLSYEFIRFAARSKGRLWKWSSQPGLWLQRVTTREPDDSQLETAIKALETAMALEQNRGGELTVA